MRAGVTYNTKVGHFDEIVGVKKRVACRNIHVHKALGRNVFQRRRSLLSKEQHLEKCHFEILGLACLSEPAAEQAHQCAFMREEGSNY